MTGWFDFVSYGVGLTKLRFRKFLLALIVSALLSDLPFVATGKGFRELQNQNFNIKKNYRWRSSITSTRIFNYIYRKRDINIRFGNYQKSN